MRNLRWLIALVALLLPLFASANPTKRAQAQTHYDAALAHYHAEEYAAAVDEFEAAYALRPEPGWLYNLGQACRLAHQPDKALDYYQRYLTEKPDAPNRAAVEQRIVEVKATLAAASATPPPPPPTADAQPVPAAALPPTSEPPPVERTDSHKPHTPYQVGARVRGLFVTRAMLSPYLQAATSMTSWSVGAEFIYRKRTFDIVTSLDYSALDVKDGNYLANNHDADVDTHYLQFRGLSFLSADVSLIGHHEFNSWFELRYGGGLGIGAVLGHILTTNDWGGCTVQNAQNGAQCHPQGVDLTSKNAEQQLQATQSNGGTDSASNPKRHVEGSKPPVMGVVNLLVGFRFKLPQHFAVTAEVGFRDAIFAGVGIHYLF